MLTEETAKERSNQRDKAVNVREKRRSCRSEDNRRYLRYAICAAFGTACGAFVLDFPAVLLLLGLFVGYVALLD